MDVRGPLSAGAPPWRVVVLGEVESTMIEARRLAERGERGVAVIARRQSAGTGRLDRPWLSPEGGLWTTVLVQPLLAAEQSHWLTLAAAVSVAEALDGLGFKVGIKWPNDVLAASGEQSRRKVCGIRAEAALGEEGIAWAAVGVGLNVNNEQFPGSLAQRATSLKQMNGGRRVCRTRCARAVLARLAENFRTLETTGFGKVREAWLARAVGIGERATVRDVEGQKRGFVVGMDEKGRLLLREQAGRSPVPVLSGDLVLRFQASQGG